MCGGGAPENRAFSDFGYYQLTRYLECILPNYAMSTFRLSQRNDGCGQLWVANPAVPYLDCRSVASAISEHLPCWSNLPASHCQSSADIKAARACPSPRVECIPAICVPSAHILIPIRPGIAGEL